MSEARPRIAVDVDDVVAGTMEATRLWANRVTGAALTPQDYHTSDTYWEYYNSIWARHGLSDRIRFEQFLTMMETDQSHIPVVEGARAALERLQTTFDIIFITSRPMAQREATRMWLDEHIGLREAPLYIAHNPKANHDARSKGEICAELGVSLLVDDNPNNCQSALDYGIDAVLFGSYGWNDQASEQLPRCATWSEVEEYLLHERA